MPPEDYVFMLLSALEGVSLIEWTIGRSVERLVGFNYLIKWLERSVLKWCHILKYSGRYHIG